MDAAEVRGVEMQGLYVGAFAQRWQWFVSIAICSACQSEAALAPGADDSGPQIGATTDALRACEPLDTTDTTCDGADDDCDGALDENCDFGPSDCPDGAHVIAGGADRDWLWGTSRADCILGYGGDDMLFGFDGDDVIVGGPGDDTLSGGGGEDTLYGDRGGDSLFGNHGDDRLDGGEGNDFLLGGEGNDTLNGGACHDQLVGVAGTDVLHGDEGSDRIVGWQRHHIDGGGGVDACAGTSCELSGADARLCVRDADCGAGEHCVSGAMVCVAHDEVAGADATCDGYDDDCDGRMDEDYASEPSSCGIGACAASGATTCVDGEIAIDCTPGTPADDDAGCDGIDDDCDGATDEHYEPQVTSCEVSGCLARGATACLSGSEEDLCMSQPTCIAEIWCEDEVDNDGDGRGDCADPDCQQEPHCLPQPFGMTVMGRSNLWGAGHDAPPGSGVSELPPGIALRLRGGAVMTFASASGTIFDFERAWGPDGTLGATNVPDAGGIAGYRLFTRARGLIGVFLSDAAPTGPAPARLTLQDCDFPELRPGLRQAFFIGDGRTDAGEVQRFIVPDGATRFFMGHADACSSTLPGCFSDNAGSFEAQGDIRFDP